MEVKSDWLSIYELTNPWPRKALLAKFNGYFMLEKPKIANRLFNATTGGELKLCACARHHQK